MKVSVVIPIYNEEQSLEKLFQELLEVLSHKQYQYEIIAVNDASTDGTSNVLTRISLKHSQVKVIHFDKNYGQTAALSAGMRHSSGDIIVFIDSDLENDPKDIPRLVDTLNQGYDVVSGWRKNRWERQWLTRKLPSIIANKIISRMTGIRLHDFGCTLKAYRKEVLENTHLYGEMHRFIPACIALKDGRVTEIPVNHRPRKYGQSHYGISRMLTVTLDIILIRFFDKYMNKPMHFFGGIGFLSIFLGFVTGTTMILLKVFHIRDMITTPLPTLTMLFIVIGGQLIVIGILGEVLMRIYYETQDKKVYHIKEKINF